MPNRNKILIPEAKSGLDKFKFEVANDIGITNYGDINKGNLTSRQNGSVGGYVGGEMVKRMIKDYESKL